MFSSLLEKGFSAVFVTRIFCTNLLFLANFSGNTQSWTDMAFQLVMFGWEMTTLRMSQAPDFSGESLMFTVCLGT